MHIRGTDKIERFGSCVVLVFSPPPTCLALRVHRKSLLEEEEEEEKGGWLVRTNGRRSKKGLPPPLPLLLLLPWLRMVDHANRLLSFPPGLNL